MGLQLLTGWLVEEALSVDNLFVMRVSLEGVNVHAQVPVRAHPGVDPILVLLTTSLEIARTVSADLDMDRLRKTDRRGP